MLYEPECYPVINVIIKPDKEALLGTGQWNEPQWSIWLQAHLQMALRAIYMYSLKWNLLHK